MKSRQKGMSLIGFFFILAIVGFFGFMVMKLFPPYYHYFGVERALNEMKTEDLSGKSQQQIRAEFMYKLSFQYADQEIHPSDIHFVQSNGATTFRVDYEKRVHFLYNIDFLLHFQKSIALTGSIE